MATMPIPACGGVVKYGLVKPPNHALTFVCVTLDGHSYTLEVKGAGKQLKCQSCKTWIRKTDGVVLHKANCRGGPDNVDKMRRAVIDWAYFISFHTEMAMTGPFIGTGRLCGLELGELDFIAARDRIDDLLESIGRQARTKIMNSCKTGAKEVRKFNIRYPNGPAYTAIVRGAEAPVVVRNVPVDDDLITTLANIETERQRAVAPIQRDYDAGVTRIQAFLVEATIIIERNGEREERIEELNRQYNAQRDAAIAEAAAQNPGVVPPEESDQSGASSSDSDSD